MPILTPVNAFAISRKVYGANLSNKVIKSSLVMSATKQLVSSRECEVLQLIAFEYSTQEIADALYVSFDTALTHRKNLLKKLKVKNAAGLVRAAFEQRYFSHQSQELKT
jgi:DNA-binding CsgD family transcriptional regulator